MQTSVFYSPEYFIMALYGEYSFSSIAQWRGDWTPVCSEGLTASQNAPNGSYGPYDHGTCMGNA
jgi:hypothetical protein